MATTRSFQTMLNEFLPNRLLKEEMVKRDYILSTCKKRNDWKGGQVIVPFKGAYASSVRMGRLTASNDISQSQYVRGRINAYKEAWGSLVFNHTDLMQHDGKIPESTFIRVLEDNIPDFLDYMKMVVSVQLGTGPHFARLTATGTAGGVITVDRIDRFCIGQKVTVDDNNSNPATGYVSAINIDENQATIVSTRGGATAVDLSGYAVANVAVVYTDGAQTESFMSARSALLSLANGGSANLHGVTKLSYPYLQAVNIDGSGWTSANILTNLFDAYTTVRQKAKGNANEVICSYVIGGAIMKQIETSNTGNFNISVLDRKASLYGWDEIMLNTVKGRLKIVMIQEWDNDVVWFRDPMSHTFLTNGFFKKRMNPDGDEYFELRAETGYQYIVDHCLFGEMQYEKPGSNAMVHSIPETVV